MNHTDLSQSTFDNKPKFKLGVVVNPFAGIGGALALKGSDGAEIREKALAMGAEKKSQRKNGESAQYSRGFIWAIYRRDSIGRYG